MPALFGYPMSSSDGATSSIRKMSDDLIKMRINEEVEEDFYPENGRRMSYDYDRKSSISGLSSNDSLWGDARRLSEAGLRRTSDNSVVLTEDTDSFIIGDRVWVGGSKPGHIAFIGETQFAPGDWAGIVLDEPIGKNNGSVGGIKYFQCENKKGVFSRLGRLTRYPLVNPLTPSSPTPSTPPPTPSPVSNAKLSSILKTPSLTNPPSPVPTGELKVGERVIVMSSQGSKAGVLRFKGYTSFAEGVWCGVELDDPLGKNDGSVEGIRYFTCEPKYGLFAPSHKVSRSPAPGRRPSCQIHHSSVRRASSKESINSTASSIRTNTTSTSTARVRLGVNSLKKPMFARPSALPATPKPSSQELLKSKQDQINQLLKERELDRSSLTKAAEQADEAERKLSIVQVEFDSFRMEASKKLKELNDAVTSLEKEKKDLLVQLEDVQFRAEEETFFKSDIQELNEKNKEKIKELTNLVVEQRGRIEELAVESRMLKDSETALILVREELEHLKSAKDTMEKEFRQELINTMDRANRMEKNCNEAQDKLDSILNSNDTNKNLLEESNTSIDNLKIEIEELKVANKELNAQIVKQETFKNDLLKSAELKEEDNRILTNQLVDIKNSLVLLETERNKLLEKIDLISTNNEKAVKDLSVKIEEFNLLNSNYLSLQENCNKYLKEIEEKSIHIDKLNKEQLNNRSSTSKLIEQLNERNQHDRNALKGQLDDCNTQLKLMAEELEKTKLLNAESNKQIQTLTGEIERLKQIIEENSNSIDYKEKEVLALKTELEPLKSESLKLKESMEEYKKKDLESLQTIGDVKTQLETLQNEKKTLETDKDNLKQKLENMGKEKNNEIELLNSQINNKANTIANLEQKLSETESVVKENQSIINDKSQAIEKLTNNLQVASEKITNLVKAEEDLRENEQKLTLELGNVQRKLENLEERCKELATQKEKLENDIVNVMNSSSDSSSQLTKLNNELVGVHKEFENFKTNSATALLEAKNKEQELILKLSSAKEENEKLKNEYNNYLSSSKESSLQMEHTYVEKIHHLENEIKVCLTTSENDKKQNTELKERLSKLEQTYKEKINCLENEIKVCSMTSENDKKQNEELKEKILKLEQTCSEVDNKYAECEQSRQVLLKEIEETNKKLTGDEKENLDMKQKLDDFVKQVSSLENVIKNLNEEKGILDGRLVESEHKYEELAKSLNKINAENELLLNQTQNLKSSTESELLNWQNQIKEKDRLLTENDSKIKCLENEIENFTSIINQKTGEVKSKLEEIELLKNKVSSVESENSRIKKENESLAKSREELLKDLKERNTKLCDDEKRDSEKTHKIEELSKQVLSLESLVKNLNEEKGILDGKIVESKQKYDELSKTLSKINAENELLLNKSQDLKTSTESELINCQNLIKEKDKVLAENCTKIKNLENEIANFTSDLNKKTDEVKSKLEEIESLQSLLSSVQCDNNRMNEENQNLTITKEELMQNIATLETMLSANQGQTTDLTSHLQKFKMESQSLEKTNALLKTQLDEALKEIRQLKEKPKSNDNMQNMTDESNNWLEEKELANSEINFLNSIIVDLRNKNEALMQRLNEIDLGESYELQNKKVKAVAPRLFCDICDVFDAHETEDCPRQATESPPPLQDHKPAPRNVVRPYCEHCEVFGHDTADCDYEETF
ncbi:restin homolog isoform X3 [Cimex lectularius]|uniref:CAP-Gly domain-containing protein n=1 Tax=Cimex lectularius TaxID=79782 RepID=A0A8I6S2S1_CIMLE|nr:restin homolog isoform X3 [Cimex lectularius]